MPFVRLSDGSIAHVSVGGPEHVITVNGKDVVFEMHGFCGPTPLNKRGDPKELGPRHRFWHAVTCWAQQGYRVDGNGKCIWEEPPDPTEGMIRVGRNYYTPVVYERLFGKVTP